VHSKKFSEHLAKHTIRTDKFESLPFPLQVYPERTPKPAKESGDTVTLLMFGFLSAYKGYEAALNALRLLPDNFRLVFAGGQHPSNPHDITFENILAFLHQGVWLHHRQIPPVGEVFTPEEHRAFETRVELTGHLPTAEITKAIDKADIVLAPYLLGGSPAGSAAVAWPISLGKPTIVSSAHTFDDYIEANCVIAVTPGASYHLARAIKALASDPDEMQRLSAAALAFARQNSVEATSLKILNKMQALRPRSVVKKEISQPATP
jgi:glycosyltransferase involved in cell wall biosynthesis